MLAVAQRTEDGIYQSEQNDLCGDGGKYWNVVDLTIIDFPKDVFGVNMAHGTPAQKEFNAVFREKAFELAVKHNVDLIFTYVCAFEVPQEREYLTRLSELFKAVGGDVDMWKIVHIFDGDYGCEENMAADGELMVSVTVRNENGEEVTESVPDAWLRKNRLDIGSEWPDYSDFAIETKDLLLKKASFEDWKDMYKNIWSREESARYMLWEVTKSEEEAIQRIKRTVEYQKKVKYAFFIYEKSTNKAIGFAGMKEIEPGVYEDCGVGFGPEYVGKGYGTQVLNALVSEAKANGATKFIASCRTQNAASHNLQMKCGFSFSHNEDRIDTRNNQPYILEFNEKIL